MSNREQQQDEIDLLQNIIFDKMKIVESEPNFKIFMEIKSDIEEPKMKFHLTVTLNDEYPDKEPTFELLEVNNFLATAKVKELESKLASLCTEYLSMPMMYQMYECILSYADEEEEKLLKEEKAEQLRIEEEQKLLEQKRKEEEEKLLEQRTYTPVTKELFDKWYKNFIKKKKEEKKEKEPNSDKLTGRQFFLNKNLKIEGNEENEEYKAKNDEEEDNKIEDNKEEENVEYNPELYEEDIGNIDFEKEDIDIDKI
jgi:Fe-S-cluster containining protein